MNRSSKNSPRGRLAAPALLAAAALGTGLLAAAPATASPTVPQGPSVKASPGTAEARAVGRFQITLYEGSGTGGKVLASARLNCSPTAGSTHPRPAEACRLMERAGGQFSMLPARRTVCPTVHKPVTVVAKGYWESAARIFAQIYPNSCEAGAKSSGVFDLGR